MTVVLPEEILFQLLLTIKGEAIFRFCQTNSIMRRICGDEKLWQEKVSREYRVVRLPGRFRSWKDLYKLLFSGKAKPFIITLAGRAIDTVVYQRGETMGEIGRQLQDYRSQVEEYYQLAFGSIVTIEPICLTYDNQILILEGHVLNIYKKYVQNPELIATIHEIGKRNWLEFRINILGMKIEHLLKWGRVTPGNPKGILIRKGDGGFWRWGYAIEIGFFYFNPPQITLRICFRDRRKHRHDIWPYIELNRDIKNQPGIVQPGRAYYIGVFRGIDPDIKTVTLTFKRMIKLTHMPDGKIEGIDTAIRGVAPIVLDLKRAYTEEELRTNPLPAAITINMGIRGHVNTIVAVATY